MKKREYCESHETIAYYSGLNGLEIRGIEHGMEDYVYCVSGAWGGSKGFHRCKVYYSVNESPFFKVHGYKVPLDECIRTGV
jgi:hypothetical protein|nr:MAG TPA: hypothetical protein [Caudoviricetes sp.]